MRCHAILLAIATNAFVLPTRRYRVGDALHRRAAADDDCATVDELNAEAELLMLQAETMKLEAQKAGLLLAREVAARAKASREEAAALDAMAATADAAAQLPRVLEELGAALTEADPADAAARRDEDFQAKVLERRDAAAQEPAEAVVVATPVPLVESDCETVEDCVVEERALAEQASVLSLEAEKLRLEAQKAELIMTRERLERTALNEAETIMSATLDAADAPVVEAVVEEAESKPEKTANEIATEEALDALFPVAPLDMTPEAAELLKKACFADDKGFRCDTIDICERGAIFRGSTRNQAAKDVLAKCTARLPSSGWRLFALEDPVPPSDEEVEARLDDARDRMLLDVEIADGSPDAPPNELMAAARRPLVIIAVAAETRPLQIDAADRLPTLGVATRLAGLLATAASAAAFSVAAGAGNEALYDRLQASDESAFAAVAPVGVGIFAILLVHELAHVVLARKGGVDWSLPILLPSLSTGSLGAANELKDHAPSRSALFDTAIAGPLAGLALSILFMIIGSALQVDPLTAPAVPALAIRSSALGSVLVAIGAPAALSAPAEASVALHPLVVSGLAGLAINALALLPLGRTDGGRCALGAYGRTLGAGLQGLVTLFVGVAAIVGGDDLLLFHLLWVFGLQRDLEAPCVDEVTDAPGRRLVYALALILAGLCLLPLAPVAPSTVLPGFPRI